MQNRLLLVLSGLLLAASAPATSSQINHAGAHFIYWANRSGGLTNLQHYGGAALPSDDPYGMDLVASLDHSPSTGGATVFVDGYHSGVQQTQLHLYSANYDGTFLAHTTLSVQQAGTWDAVMYLSPAQFPWWGYTTLVVRLPANGTAQLYGATVVSP